jgi:hypothetical protein
VNRLKIKVGEAAVDCVGIEQFRALLYNTLRIINFIAGFLSGSFGVCKDERYLNRNVDFEDPPSHLVKLNVLYSTLILLENQVLRMNRN